MATLAFAYADELSAVFQAQDESGGMDEGTEIRDLRISIEKWVDMGNPEIINVEVA